MIKPIETLTPIERQKQKLCLLIAEDKIDNALQELIEFTSAKKMVESYNQTLLQASKHKEYQTGQINNTLSFEQLNLMKARIVMAILQIINQLNEKEAVSPKPKKIVTEKALKLTILVLLIASKVILFFFLYTHLESGGFTKDQFLGTVTLLVPVFAAYSVLAVQDIYRNKDKTGDTYPKYILTWSYIIMIGYLCILLFGISLKPSGVLNFQQMNSLVTTIEVSFGVLVGQIMMDLFKKRV